MSNRVTIIALALLAFGAAPVLATPAVEFGAWSTPINVGPPINTEYNDTYQILTADGRIVLVLLAETISGFLGARPLTHPGESQKMLPS
jgi:hypothetical protein